MGRRAVYTCLFGYSEPFNDFTYDRSGVDDFICFTDDVNLRSSFWQVRVVPQRRLDPARASKRVKVLPHLFLGGFSSSLYIDNTVRLKVAPGGLFDQFLEPARSPYVCFRHHLHRCVYEEAEAVIRLEYDQPARVQAQMQVYRELGYPALRGLSKGAFLLRRHMEYRIRPVMERWFQEILQHSHRDQLSFDVVAWLHKFEPEYLPVPFDEFSLLEWPVFKDGCVRVPRDFDDARYLALYPDVRSQRNPRLHFATVGAAEGRPYK